MSIYSIFINTLQGTACSHHFLRLPRREGLQSLRRKMGTQWRGTQEARYPHRINPREKINRFKEGSGAFVHNQSII